MGDPKTEGIDLFSETVAWGWMPPRSYEKQATERVKIEGWRRKQKRQTDFSEALMWVFQ